jgi:hypothetical protein
MANTAASVTPRQRARTPAGLPAAVDDANVDSARPARAYLPAAAAEPQIGSREPLLGKAETEVYEEGSGTTIFEFADTAQGISELTDHAG